MVVDPETFETLDHGSTPKRKHLTVDPEIFDRGSRHLTVVPHLREALGRGSVDPETF